MQTAPKKIKEKHDFNSCQVDKLKISHSPAKIFKVLVRGKINTGL